MNFAGETEPSARQVDRADFLIKAGEALTPLKGELEPSRIAQDQPRKHVGRLHGLMAAKAARPEALVRIDALPRP